MVSAARRDGVLEAGLLVEDPRLDRAQVRVRAHVPPQVGVVLDRAAAHHLLDPVGVDLPGAVVGRDPDPREGPEDRRPRGHHPGAARRARTASSPTGRAAAAGSGGCRRRRRSPGPAPSIATWTWVPKISSWRAMQPELVDQLAVAGAVDDLLVLPERERVGPGRRQQQPALLGDLGHRAAQRRAARSPAAAHVRRRAWSRSPAPTASARASPGPRAPSGTAREDRLDLLREVEAVGVEDHQLLLDPDRERRAVEAVFEH